MKFTFEETGNYSRRMGNSCDESGSFFLIEEGPISIDYVDIFRYYGMCHIHKKGIDQYGIKSRDILFVPEQTYPLIDLMIDDIRKLNNDRKAIFNAQKEIETKEKEKRLEKIKSFIDISVPIEV